mmetsp:Transcript_21552/g.41156  ORF Transcript_21552/g.41156 Transcript_21552/m.41156 type:complete len:272 (+) Transcript_21552:1113-1928(+)
MVLHNVADDARAVKVTSTTLSPKILLEYYLHIGNVVSVPQLLIDLVAKSQRDKIQHYLLAQVMVNPKKFILSKGARRDGVQFIEGPTIAAKGLFNQQSCPTSRRRASCCSHTLADIAEHRRWNGEEEKSVGRAATFGSSKMLIEFLEAFRLVVSTGKKQTFREEFGLVFTFHVGALLFQECSQVYRRPTIASDSGRFWNQRCFGASIHQLVERRIKFLPGQITSGTQNHNGQREFDARRLCLFWLTPTFGEACRHATKHPCHRTHKRRSWA